MSNLNHIIAEQQPMFEALKLVISGKMTNTEFKPICGSFGILPQRNGKFAVRVRIPGGEASLQKLEFLAALAKKLNPGYIHLSSREAIQFHDLEAPAVGTMVKECTANGLPFRGGGGNSFRNISVTEHSGIAPDSTHDLVPYAQYLTNVIFDWDEAFQLPRKLKISFASDNNPALAYRQDLAFLETCNDKKEHGFKVVGGGGFGRNPAPAVTLLEFIPPSEIARATQAMVELFSEHGDRVNRATARIRYIVSRLGAAEFIKLYRSYFDKLENEVFPSIPDIPPDWSGISETHPTGHQIEEDSKEFQRWRELTAEPTRFHKKVSVTLFVPRGVLSVDEFSAVVKLLKKLGIPAVRLTQEQNILIPALPELRLGELYANLQELPIDLCFKSFHGQLETCIGATVCVAGILNTPIYGVAVADTLDQYFKNHPEKFSAKCAKEIVHSLRFSGCPSSCVAHQAARFGFQGIKRRVNEVLTDGFTLWSNPNLETMGKEDPTFIPASELPAKVLELLKNAKII